MKTAAGNEGRLPGQGHGRGHAEGPGQGRAKACRALTLRCLLAAVVLSAAGCALPKPYAPPRNGASGFTFYVSPDGDDDNDGLTPERPWRTLEKADAVVFKPGYRLRLRGGSRYRGTLSIGPKEAGSERKPVVIESYGKGRATIAASGTAGISVFNTAGVEIRNLALVGDGRSYKWAEGIRFLSDLPDDRKLSHVVVDRVDVSHFRNGLLLAGRKGATGFRNVRITDSALHGNLEAGLSTTGPKFRDADPTYAHERVSVVRVRAFANPGDRTTSWRNTGSGIVLGSVRDAQVQRSTAYRNGAGSSPRALEGPEGIWAYDSTRVVMEHNVSYGNRTGSYADGGGFGLDNNVSSSVMQYNLSFGNDGPGFLVYTSIGNGAHRDNTVRFNISNNDARKLPMYGGIVAYGAWVRDLDIYHNTVVLRAAKGPVQAPALRLEAGLRNVTIRNNVFVTNGAPLVASEQAYRADVVALQGNDYFSTDTWQVVWGTRKYPTLREWRAGGGQEQHATGPTGTDADPCLKGSTAPISSAQGAARMMPGCVGELRAAALDLTAVGVDPGEVDYFGESLAPTIAAGAAQPVSEE